MPVLMLGLQHTQPRHFGVEIQLLGNQRIVRTKRLYFGVRQRRFVAVIVRAHGQINERKKGFVYKPY